jgi:chloramphenicol-sensitive protein RarD
LSAAPGSKGISASDGTEREGLIYAIACYCWWGLLPLYFGLLHAVGSFEVVTQRIIWSLALILFILAARSALPALARVLRDRAIMIPLFGSACFIGCNWTVYVWAVHNGHVLAGSLGYFLNPLVNIMLGMIFLKERLRRAQVVAVGTAAMGVAILAASALSTLWISLTLAFSFGFYALIRKTTPVPAMQGLAAETLILLLPALGYLGWLAHSGQLAFGTDLRTTILLVLAGGVTAAPLILFAMAARRLSMATLGIMQYISPTLQFLSGVVIFGEGLNGGQMTSFALIWLSLILFTADSIQFARRVRLAPA